MINWKSRAINITKGYINKQLGQNFLINSSVIHHILDRIIIANNILEIGPGIGILSYGILHRLQPGAKFTIIEKDGRLIEDLKILLEPIAQSRHINLSIIHGDGLLFIPQEPVQIISNIPYNISSLLLYHWFHNYKNILSITIMIQKEMAEKLVKPYNINRDYGPLSVLIQGLGTVKKIMDLNPQSFIPAPKVFSQVIYFQTNNSHINMELLWSLLQQAFSNPRKQLQNNIREPWINFMIQNNWSHLRPAHLSPQAYISWSQSIL